MADSKFVHPLVAPELPAVKTSRSGGSRKAASKTDVVAPAGGPPLCTPCGGPSGPVFHKPDGRGCPCCWHKDDLVDPVAEELRRLDLKDKPEGYADSLDALERCWWSYPPDPKTGETVGILCGYCLKIYNATKRHKMHPTKHVKYTVEIWLEDLGEPGELKAHHETVKELIVFIVQKGGARGCHPNWKGIEGKVLASYKAKLVDTKVKAPLHYTWEQYKFAGLETSRFPRRTARGDTKKAG